MFSAIKRIRKMGAIAFLMIVQLSIGLTMINTSGKLLQQSSEKKKGLESLFNVENSIMFNLEPLVGMREGNLFRAQLDSNKANVIFDELKKEGLITKKLLYSSNPNVLEFDELKDNMPKKYEDMIDTKKMDYSSYLVINDEFLKHYNLKISSGRNLNSDDFNVDYKTDNIPILLGKDYEGVFEIGKTFSFEAMETVDEESSKIGDETTTEYTLATANFEVVGFLGKNAIPVTTRPDEAFSTSIIYSDSIMIMPPVKDFIFFSEGRQMVSIGVILEYSKGTSVEKLKNTINEKLKKYDLKMKDVDISGTNLLTETYDRDVKSSLMLGGLLLLLSMVGTSIMILGDLKNRKNEFGIKIAAGATLKEIGKDVIFEILTISIIASLIAIILNMKTGVGLTIVLLNIVIVILMTLIIAIAPILEIKKMNIIDLVREK